MKYVGNVQSQANAEVYATASGTLPNGKAVVVNSDGTVSTITAESEGFKNPVIFGGNTSGTFTSSTFDSNSNRIVIAYRDGSTGYGYAVVGTVNPANNTISFGTRVVFESAYALYIAATFDSNLNKIVIAYQDASNSGYTTSIVGTVNPANNSISFGTAVVVRSAYANWVSATFDSNSNKVVITCEQYAFVGTVSGTGISFGSQVAFAGALSGVAVDSTFDSNSNKVVLAYSRAYNGRAIVGTVSGTNISFGNEATTASGGVNAGNAVVFDSNSNKCVVITCPGSGTVSLVGTVSGTNISFGSAVAIGTIAEFNTLVFDSSTNKIIYFFLDASGGYRAKSKVGTVSGTSISFTAANSFAPSASTASISGTFDSTSNKIVMAAGSYEGGYKKAGIYAFASTSLTAENYIGITNGAVVSEVNSKVAFESAQITNASSTIDTNVNRIVIAYLDEGNSSYGTAIVGTISGSTVSFGTAVVFSSSATKYTSTVFDSNSNKIIIGFEDSGASGHGKCIVGTINAGNNSISFGTVATFEAAAVSYVSLAFDSNSNKAVVAFVDEGDSNKGKARVATVSGTNISFGSIQTFANAATTGIFSAFDSNSNKVVISYGDTANSGYGTSIVGTVSATNISFGSEVAFASHEINFSTSTFDSSNNKIVLAYKNEANNQGTAIVGTVSGTGISFGTAVVFSTLSTASVGSTFDTATGKVLLTFDTGGAVTRIISGTVSGTGISFSASTIFTGLTLSQSFTIPNYNSVTNNVLIVLTDSGNSAYGTAVVFSEEIRGSTASGSTAIIQAGGAVNTLQTGLTPGQQYFVQTDGTLGLTAATPSVIAGTAVSATDLIVKG